MLLKAISESLMGWVVICILFKLFGSECFRKPKFANKGFLDFEVYI